MPIIAKVPVDEFDLGALQARLNAVLALDFERVACDHTERILEGAHVDQLKKALEWAGRLSRGTHAAMLARTFWHQPGFLADLVRYKLR